MASEMQERIARAICEYQGRSWGASDAAGHDYWKDMAFDAMKAIQSYADEARDEWGFEHGDLEDLLKAEIAAAEEARRDQD